MDIRQGTGVFPGIAVGKLFLYQKSVGNTEKQEIADPDREVGRYLTAKDKALSETAALQEKTLREVGEEEAEIFAAHQLLLDDPDFSEGVMAAIRQEKFSAEYAVSEVGRLYEELFLAMEDDYMRARAADIRDITDRLLANLQNKTGSTAQPTEPVILCAEDLTPSETMQFEKDKILAFVMQKGSANSHTAILARMRNIPCIIGVDIDLDPALAGHPAIADGSSGRLYIDPTRAVMEELQNQKKNGEQQQVLLREMVGLGTVTQSGKSVRLYSNIGGPEDIDAVLEQDSEGIGLFRTEFLYLGREDYPTEEEQYEIYKEVLSRMEGRQVIFRTLDIGADKQAEYFRIPQEENPAMGFRAIRFCLEHTAVFKTQLRAIYRSSAFGRAAVMFPMVVSVEEVQRAKEIVEEVKAELRQEEIPFGEVELGIMVETPAAVMIADLLAEEVDFFSIGTNDLTQYTLAVDRQNPSLKKMFDPHHEAILRMIRHTCQCAHEHGIWCGICGELAADLSLTERFVEMGIDELSVSPAFTLKLRKKIRDIN